MILKNIRYRAKLPWNNLKVAWKYDVLIEKAVTLKYVDTISFGKHCTLQSGVYVYGSRFGKRVVFGDYVVIGGGCMLFGDGGMSIGDFVHLGPNVVISTQGGDTHTMCAEVPTMKYAEVRFGKGCWIGAGSVVMPGTVLGDCCLVWPNSVVCGSWPSGVTLSGNPARRVRGSFGVSSRSPA